MVLFPQSMVPAGPLVAWFCLLAAKHVLADFYLQPEWMALGKDRAAGWLRPLVLHCLVHGALTTLLLLAFARSLWALGLVDFAIHLAIDRCKGIVTSRYGLTPADRPFWGVLGIDQALHHATGFFIALIVAGTP